MFNARNLFILLIAALLGLWFFASRKNAAPVFDRPNDPWVFRSVLDKTPRMVTLALEDRLWVAYSTDSCSLYKAWSGGVNFVGAVYNTAHGPQPTTLGNSWFENKHRQPWTVAIGGKSETPRTDYKGHRYTEDGQAEIFYDLVLASGQRIRVNERPEFVERDRQLGFERTFRLENCPDGAIVSLKTNAASVASAAHGLVSDGKLTFGKTEFSQHSNLTAAEVEAELALNPNAETHLTTWFVNTPLVDNPFDDEADEEEVAAVSPGQKLIARSDCATCHNAQVQTVGPAYVSISERYKNTPENTEKLAAKIIAGGAGVWGTAAMSAHPDLKPDDAKTIVSYILSLDEGADDGEGGTQKSLAEIPAESWLKPDNAANESEMSPGLLVKVYQFQGSVGPLSQIKWPAEPTATAIAGKVYAGAEEFGQFKDNFALTATGYLFLEKDDNVLLQLTSDDGTRLYLDNQLLIDNDGFHGDETKEAEVALRAGLHPLRIEYFQGGGGRVLALKWARFGQPDMKVIPEANLRHRTADDPAGVAVLGGGPGAVPGDGVSEMGVHPAYTVSQARPDEFLPKVAGMDFLSDGRLVVSTWDAMGGVYILENVESGDPKKIKVKLFAKGLAEPLGVKVVNDTIYVLQKQELTQLIDTDRDGVADQYNCFAKGWRASANFHEFAFGLAFKDGHFYATLATAILPGGASARPQILDRGKVLKISKKDGSVEFIARGLRTPNGIGIGADGELFVADNQGDWLPSSKIVHVKPGAFYGSYSVDSVAVAQMPVQQPVVWLPQDEIGNSPSQPTFFADESPYKGQMLHGEVTHGGLKRVFAEKVNGDYQGCVFRFTQGLEAGINRVAWGPDGALYVGGVGNPGNWSHQGGLWYGLQRLKFNGNSAFEMLAVRAKTNGLEIEFTEPLPEGAGWSPDNYLVKQWYYKPTVEYGGPKLDETELKVASASVSSDRKKVFLEIVGIKPLHVVYLRLRGLPLSDLGHEIWATEAWYTMNSIPADNFGTKTTPPTFAQTPDNQLSEKEKRDGWQLLFDGQSTAGWHSYGQKAAGKKWEVADGTLHLTSVGSDGGDLVTDAEFGDFELKLDWKISACGNSGIIYWVQDDAAKYSSTWLTGPEMQVLDNGCPSIGASSKHHAGDLYDLVECKYQMARTAGDWNRVRIVSKNGRLEHWLNDRKLVDIQAFENGKPTKAWLDLIAGSKFKDMPAFGRSPRGRIALQDHGNEVWYRNVKIRKF